MVFVSQDSARDMRELVERSQSAASLKEFRSLLSVELEKVFDSYVTPLAQHEGDAYKKLRRTEFTAIGHDGLVRFVEQRIPALVQRADGRPADPTEVRLRLSDFAWHRLGQNVTAIDVVNELNEHGYSEQPLGMSVQVRGRIKDRNKAYIHRIQKTLINGSHIPRSQAAAIVQALTTGESVSLVGRIGG